MITNKIIGLFLMFGVFAGCSRSQNEIGRMEDRYEAVCVQRETSYGYGVTSHGHVVSTRTRNCVLHACERSTVLIGKYWWNDTKLSSSRVSMSECERYL